MNLWKSLNQSFVYVILVIAIVVLTMISYITYIWPPSLWLHPELMDNQRLTAAEICVGAGGLIIAILVGALAVYEFRQAQRKPDLELLFKHARTPEPSDLFEFPILDTPRPHEFELVLHNKGNGVARQIKVDVYFLHAPIFWAGSKQQIWLMNDGIEPGKFWRIDVEAGSGIKAHFYGREEWVCHDNDYQFIGKFGLEREPGVEYDTEEHRLPYRVRAEGMREWKSGNLRLKMLPPDEPGVP